MNTSVYRQEDTSIPFYVKEFLKMAVLEDEGQGDITSRLLISPQKEAIAYIIAKEDFVLAGIPFVLEVFKIIDDNMELKVFINDGEDVKKSQVIGEAVGLARSLLLAERISLNILQRLSGVATLTRSFVEQVKGLAVKIIDTRKTTPCMRFMEKYGVRVGGGVNHRFNLSDGLLIKDNHIKMVGGIEKAIKLASNAHHLLKIEIEVKSLEEFEEALISGADVIMLDNMSIETMIEAVRIRDKYCSDFKKKILLEASGGVNIENVRKIAETGIDFISIGALTHSARAVDISMKFL
ncbi:MAG: carboxylating nicotinate-nucleotide diphosphorylase [Thermodesulfovibrionales bacterium]|nr:carboxylating nicotinate-nucleotide diphosphorylase [Thermodesulfovibrionales bacterium]